MACKATVWEPTCADCDVPLTEANVSFSSRRCSTCWEALGVAQQEEPRTVLSPAAGVALLDAWTAEGRRL